MPWIEATNWCCSAVPISLLLAPHVLHKGLALIAAAPIYLMTRYGKTSGTNNSVDDNVSSDSVAVDKFIWLPERNASASAHWSGNLQEAKSTGAVSQIKEVVYYADYQS
jgi:hypothetical protein